MTSIIFSFCLINFFGIVYLIFLFYQKNRFSTTKSATTSLPASLSSSAKVGLTRYNPFNDLGGDQSFILCLLDNQNSGVIITSLHSRSHTRIYAKQIKTGQTSGVTLSPEEKQTLTETIKKYESKH